MATLVLGAVGGAIGGPWGARIGMLLGSVIDQKLFATTTTTEGPKIDNVQLTSSTEGMAISKVYGQAARIAGNVIWGTDFTEHRHEDRASGGKGGGGGGGSTVQITYTYSISFALALCQGEISKIGKVWVDGTEIDISKVTHTVYLGTETQAASPFIQGIKGITNTPAYRGLAYIVFENWDVTEFGNRIPNLTVEVFPAIIKMKDVLIDISKDAGYSAANLDTTDIDTNNLDIRGYQITSQNTMRDRIEVLQAMYLFDTIERNGKITFRYRKPWTPTDIPYEMMGAAEGSYPKAESSLRTERKYELELPKTLYLKYIDFDKDYQQGSQSAARQVVNSIGDVTIDASIVLTGSEAKSIAEALLYEKWVNRVTHDTDVGLRYASLLPGDLVTLHDNAGLVFTSMVTKTSFAAPGIVKISAIDVGGIAATFDEGALL